MCGSGQASLFIDEKGWTLETADTETKKKIVMQVYLKILWMIGQLLILHLVLFSYALQYAGYFAEENSFFSFIVSVPLWLHTSSRPYGKGPMSLC